MLVKKKRAFSPYRKRVILFTSSYVPMYLIILIQNGAVLLGKAYRLLEKLQGEWKGIFKDVELIKSIVKVILCTPELYIFIGFLILTVLSLVLLHKIIKEFSEFEGESFSVRVKETKNENYQYVITYFSVYIFPFITINLASFVGILQFLILWMLIGYVYVKNNLIYVNPVLNIIYKCNIYECDMIYYDGEKEKNFNAILLSQKDENKIKGKKINIVKESGNLYLQYPLEVTKNREMQKEVSI